MTRESWIEEFLTNIENLDDSEATKKLLDWANQISIETRAAVLAEEERRVWCEGWVSHRMKYWLPVSSVPEGRTCEHADASLAAYREARAAWDARKEG